MDFHDPVGLIHKQYTAGNVVRDAIVRPSHTRNQDPYLHGASVGQLPQSLKVYATGDATP